MDSPNDWWCIVCSPGHFGKIISLFCIFLKQVFDWAGNLLDPPRDIEEVHFVVLLPHFVRKATRPGFDLVQLVLLLVVSRFTNINVLLRGQASRSSPIVAGNEHDEAAIHNLFDAMITVLARFDHFVGIEMLLDMMNSLLWAVIPAGIDPFFPFGVLPCTIDLCHDRLRDIVGVLDVSPVTDLPQLVLVEDAIRQRKAPILHQILAIRLLLLDLSKLARFYLQVDGIPVDIALWLIVGLRIIEHQVHVLHKMVDRLILLSLRLPFDKVNCDGFLNLHVIVRVDGLVGQSFKVRHFELTTRVFELPDPLQDCLDSGLHWGVYARWPASFPPQVGVVVFLAVVFPRITFMPGTGATFLLTTTIVIRILVIVLLIIFLIFLFLLLGERVRFGDLSEIRLLRIFRRDNPFFDQSVELCDENILYLKISKDCMLFQGQSDPSHVP